ncbi:hypothetical protein ALT785_530014 [Alteromonas infernus]
MIKSKRLLLAINALKENRLSIAQTMLSLDNGDKPIYSPILFYLLFNNKC